MKRIYHENPNSETLDLDPGPDRMTSKQIQTNKPLNSITFFCGGRSNVHKCFIL